MAMRVARSGRVEESGRRLFDAVTGSAGEHGDQPSYLLAYPGEELCGVDTALPLQRFIVGSLWTTMIKERGQPNTK